MKVNLKRPIKDRTHALWTGVLMVAMGSYLLWDAYEGRGRKRPFAARFLPGP